MNNQNSQMNSQNSQKIIVNKDKVYINNVDSYTGYVISDLSKEDLLKLYVWSLDQYLNKGE